MVIQMIAVGEESGSLDAMSAKVATFYEAEVDNAVDAMSSLLEPLIMAVLGVLVGGLVIAMYLPIFKLARSSDRSLQRQHDGRRRASRGVCINRNGLPMSVLELLAASPGLYIGTCLVFGLMVGSFLNVVIYRLPMMLERQWREQCAELAAERLRRTKRRRDRLRALQPRRAPFGLPGLQGADHRPAEHPASSPGSFLRGRCAGCGNPISVRYPLVELLTGLLSAAVAWKFGFGWPALAAIVLTWFLVALTFIDIDHQLLPDSLTLPLLWIGLAAEPVGHAGPAPPCRWTSAPASSAQSRVT